MRSQARVVGDLVVLASTVSLPIAARPQLEFLSYWARGGGPGGDTLGAVATTAGIGFWLGYLALSAAAPADPRRDNRRRAGLLIAMAVVFALLPTLSQVGARFAFALEPGAPVAVVVHDGGVLQTEAAADALWRGRDPYAVDYADTAMAQSPHSRPQLWRAMGYDRNPAFDFFPYPPFNAIAAAVLAPPCRAVLGGYDHRLFHLVCAAALGALCWWLPRRPELRPPALALGLLAPLPFGGLVEGTNDIACVAALAAAAYASHHQRPRTAALAVAVAAGFKQLAWIALPIYLAWRLATRTPREVWAESWPALLVLAAWSLPFLLWHPSDFLYDLVWAQGVDYPVRGTGLGATNVLVASGVVTSPRDPTPNAWAYVLVVLPVLVVAIRQVVTTPEPWRWLHWLAVVSGAFVLVSRHFAPNHLWTIWLCLLTAFVIRLDEPTR